MIKPGLYQARAASAILSETKSQREYLAIQFRTREGERADWAGYFGPNVGKDNLTLTERTSGQLRLLGWNGDWSDFSSCATNEVDITVVEEDYNGTAQIKVGFINKLGEGGFKAKPIDPAKARSFAERMRKEASSPRSSEHPNAPGSSYGREPGDDDINF